MQVVHAAALGCSGKVVSGSWSAVQLCFFCHCIQLRLPFTTAISCSYVVIICCGRAGREKVSTLLFVMPLLY